jgi:plastocyanin domain-containing protein
MQSSTKTFLIVGALLLVMFILLRGGGLSQNTTNTNTTAGSNVTMVDGQQIVTVNVKGGYGPKTSTVQAGIPTILRLITDGTYDCSSAVRIPSLGISRNLLATGVTDVQLGTLAVGTVQGTCSMGMYRFEIEAL